MKSKAGKKRLLGLGVLGVALVILLSACSAGPVTYEEAEELEAEIADLRERLSEVEASLDEVSGNSEISADIEESVNFAIDEMKTAVARLEEIEEAIAPPEVEEQPPAPGGGGGQPQPTTPAY